MSSKKDHLNREQKYMIERIAKLRGELENLRDYVDLLEARVRNVGKQRFNTEEVKKMLKVS